MVTLVKGLKLASLVYVATISSAKFNCTDLHV